MKTKVLFVARKMTVGGIESSLINLFNYINSKSDDFEITLFTFHGGKLLEKVPANIDVRIAKGDLNLISSSFGEIIKTKNPFKIAKRIYFMLYASVFGADKLYGKILPKYEDEAKYDVAISYFNDNSKVRFSRGTNRLVSDFTNAKEKIAWIHTDPELCGFDRDYCLNLYKNFDKIYCVSKAVKEKFDLLLPEYNNKTEVFYNKFSEKETLEMADEFIPFEKSDFDIVTVGRIDNDTKRIDKIIRMCRKFKDDGIFDFKWRIVGGGGHLKSNLNLAQELDVLDVMEFTGEKTNPYPYIKNSDLFALYSAYEGFPMVIGEAEILKTFILTTPYAAAYEQINEEQGIICKDDDDFYQILKQMISNKKIGR